MAALEPPGNGAKFLVIHSSKAAGSVAPCGKSSLNFFLMSTPGTCHLYLSVLEYVWF